MYAATTMSLLKQTRDARGVKEGLKALLLISQMAAGRSIADFAPLQLLLWLLDAEVSTDFGCF